MAVELIADGRLKLERNKNSTDVLFCGHLSDGSVTRLGENALNIGDGLIFIMCKRCSNNNQIAVLEKWLQPKKDLDTRIAESRSQLEILRKLEDGS